MSERFHEIKYKFGTTINHIGDTFGIPVGLSLETGDPVFYEIPNCRIPSNICLFGKSGSGSANALRFLLLATRKHYADDMTIRYIGTNRCQATWISKNLSNGTDVDLFMANEHNALLAQLTQLTNLFLRKAVDPIDIVILDNIDNQMFTFDDNERLIYANFVEAAASANVHIIFVSNSHYQNIRALGKRFGEFNKCALRLVTNHNPMLYGYLYDNSSLAPEKYGQVIANGIIYNMPYVVE